MTLISPGIPIDSREGTPDPRTLNPLFNPDGFPVSPNHALRVRLWTLSTNSFFLECIVKVWKRNKYEYIPFKSRPIIGTGNGTLIETGLMLTLGELISVSVHPATANVFFDPAETYIAVDVGLASAVTSTVTNFMRFAMLFNGYIGNTGLSWQRGMGTFNTELPVHGAYFRDATVPAAGDEYTYTGPTNSYFVVQSFSGTFVTTIGGGNRQVILNIAVPGFTIWQTRFNVNQADSITALYQAGIYLGVDTLATTIPGVSHSKGIPRLRVIGSSVVFTSTTALEIADQWTPILTLERWVIPPSSL
jgi:hypothetical protein